MKLPKEQWEDCLYCNNTGCIEVIVPHFGQEGEWLGDDSELEPCEFCHHNEKSVYYQENRLWEKEVE